MGWFCVKRFLIFLVLILSFSLAQALPHEIGFFPNCSDNIFYVEVSGFGEIYEGAYTLNSCNLISNTNQTVHRWKCECEDSLNLSIDTVESIDSTYTISIRMIPKTFEYEEMESYDSIDIHTKSLANNISDVTDNSITGNVVLIDSTFTWGFFILVVLLITILFILRRLGGLPWVDKRKRAMILHKRGQEYFRKGKPKKAKKYYSRASRLRN